MHAPYAQNRPTELGRTNQAILMKSVERMRGNGNGIKHANVSPILPHSMQTHHLGRNLQQNGVLKNNSVLGNWGLQKKGRR